jgi:hypothetical protein
MEIGKPLYPYRVNTLGSHFHLVFSSERDIVQLWKSIKKMRDKDEDFDTVYFTDRHEVVQLLIDAKKIVSLESWLNRSPMIIKDLQGKLEAVLYVKKG